MGLFSAENYEACHWAEKGRKSALWRKGRNGVLWTRDRSWVGFKAVNIGRVDLKLTFVSILYLKFNKENSFLYQ